MEYIHFRTRSKASWIFLFSPPTPDIPWPHKLLKPFSLRLRKDPGPTECLLSGRSETLAWDDVTQQAFVTIKESLASATLLVHPKPNTLTCVMADASDTAVGAVLQQYVGNRWQPVSFFSRKLKPAEKRYSAFDRELLAVYLAIKHFRYFLEGRTFQVATDHKPLTP